MYLLTYLGHTGCDVPAGNGHDPVSGEGTRTLTLRESSIVAGTNYLTIASGFAV